MSMNPPIRLPRIPKIRKIENPAVPGMEGDLSPPPPPRISECSPPREIPTPVPPPSPVPAPVPAPTMPMSSIPRLPQVPIPVNIRCPSPMAVQNHSPIPQLPNVTYPNIRGNSMYQIPPQLHGPLTMQQQTQQQIPWWIPTDNDTDESYTQWYEKAYKAALVAQTEKSTNGKPKVKRSKQQPEVVDSEQEAKNLADAQKGLAAMMKPLKCDLCNAVMNSTLQAKLHYDGKPHQKKVFMYLNQNAKAKKSEDGVSSTTQDWNAYCEICKTWFTSHTDAAQHYAGKKHMRAAYGGPRPHSKKNSSNQAPTDPTGRFGIGQTFVKEEPAPPQEEVPVSPVHSQTEIPTELHCAICNISTNRPDQLESHFKGARHKKMLKQKLPLPDEPPTVITTGLPATGPVDCSIYRTPSGQYYCALCKMTMTSEVSFRQHLGSKRHKNEVSTKSGSPEVSAPPKKVAGKKK